jgi:hypothetical protein
MSRIKELKVKYPVLALSVLDLLAMIDPTNNNKYLGLLTQLIDKRMQERLRREEIEEFRRIATRDGYPDAVVKTAPAEQLYLSYVLDAVIDADTIRIVNEFIDLNERKLIEQNDILKYTELQQVQDAISLAHIKTIDKAMASEIIRVHEDDEWLILRPLTFAASCKYGASTRWCTTAVNEPQHFHRYWSRGSLIYILNKKTGYKVAAQKFHDSTERSTLWNAADSEINWADIDTPAWVFTTVKDEINKKVTNESFCSSELADKVKTECGMRTLTFREEMEAVEPILYLRNEPINQINENLVRALTNAINGGGVREELDAVEPLPDVAEQPTPVQAYYHYEQSIEERNNPLR